MYIKFATEIQIIRQTGIRKMNTRFITTAFFFIPKPGSTFASVFPLQIK